MCRNGQYTERGIKQIDGFMSERWRIEPEYAMRVHPSLGLLGVLLEPTTVVTKAWEQVKAVGQRAFWEPRTVLVTGAGPVGLLAALMGQQRGHAIHALDLAESGPKPELVRALGGTYHARRLPADFTADIVIECTGALTVIADVMKRASVDGIVCLTGVSSSGHSLPFDFGTFNRSMVLGNLVTFGSVNANKTHYEMAAESLAKADRNWLTRLITRKVPLERWQEAFQGRPEDIKVILQFAEAA
jgi:threonine dehydrogenase-like Zn-dependent dehydrogenase